MGAISLGCLSLLKSLRLLSCKYSFSSPVFLPAFAGSLSTQLLLVDNQL